MKVKNILLISTLLLMPIFSMADTNKKTDSDNLESLDIKELIEKAKIAPLEERRKIETQIRKKIAQAHREKRFK